VLEGVHELAGKRRLVEGRDVPQIEVGEPQRQRDRGVDEPAQPAQPPRGKERLQERTGKPERDQKRCEVAEDEVLGHVDPDQLAVEPRERRGERHPDEKDPAGEARLAPPRQRPSPPCEAPCPGGVEHGDRERRDQLQRLEAALHVGQREFHRA
jgi:hypothetical protein